MEDSLPILALGKDGSLLIGHSGVSGGLTCLNPHTGVTEWRANPEPTGNTNAIVKIDAVGNDYLNVGDGKIYALSSSGAVKWTTEGASNYSFGTDDIQYGESLPIAQAGRVLIAYKTVGRPTSLNMVGIDTTSGKEVWSIPMPNLNSSSVLNQPDVQVGMNNMIFVRYPGGFTAYQLQYATTPSPSRSSISVTNHKAPKSDIVTVRKLHLGDLVKIYTAPVGGRLLGQAIANRKDTQTGTYTATVAIKQLGVKSGHAYVSVTCSSKLETESHRVSVPFSSEKK